MGKDVFPTLRKTNLALILILFVFFNASLVNAEEGDKEKKEKKYFSSTSFSFLLTRGNNEDLNFSFDTDQNLNFEKNKFNLKVNIILTSSRNKVKSEIYTSHLKYRRKIGPKAYLLGLFSFEKNKSAGYDSRFIFSIGVGSTILQRRKIEIYSDLSIGWTREDFREAILENRLLKELSQNNLEDRKAFSSYVSSVFSSRVMYNLSSTSQFILQENFFFNLREIKDWRINTSSSLSSSISQYFALKISIQLNYDHQPVPGFKSTDFFLLNSLVVKF